MRLCWLVSDLGHYHGARMHALADSGRHDLSVVQLQDRCGFKEFGATAESLAGLQFHTLFGPDTPVVPGGRLKRLLYRALDDQQPDVIFVNGWSHSSTILAMAWSLARGVPFVVVADSTAADQVRVPWQEAVKRLLVRRASAAFVAGTRQCQYLCTLGMPATRVFLGYDIVDNNHFASGADAARRAAPRVRTQLDLPARYLLAVARLVSRKGLATLIEAHARYRAGAAHANLELLLIGDGPERARLTQLAAGLGIGALVHFRGFQGYQVLPSYYGLAAALIVPSRSEPWGLVVNEAMASALPVVVSNACGCADDLVRHGHNGFVIHPADAAGLAEYLRFIDARPQQVRRMGQQGRIDIGAWGLDRFCTQCWAAAEMAVAASPARGYAAEILALEAFARTRPKPGGTPRLE